MSISPRVMVCFDLGGVLARIRRNWQACVLAADVESGLRQDEIYDLADFPLFDAYQLGSIDTHQYLTELSSYLSTSLKGAQAAHDAILDRPYEGTEQVVSDLAVAGHRTACLSNTNTLHWSILNSQTFPAIEILDFKMVSQQIRLLKPEPTVFRLFEQQAEMPPDRIVYFDDHEINVLAAKRYGWNAILVDPMGDTAVQMRQALRDIEVL
jgi:FMN phosphatase YigB (HAD superfamily)